MKFDQPPVVRISRDPDDDLPPTEWPATIPAVAQLLARGLDLPPGVTFLVGENGSGKSTLVEAVAVAYGLSPEGGSAHGRHETRTTESPLHASLRIQRGIGSGRWGFFLRAETMHGWYTYMDEHGGPNDADYHAMSHGESFLEVLRRKFSSPSFYCLDEPEAALSFGSTLTLIRALHDIAAAGGQVLCATHSPVLAAMPGARIIEVGDWGLRETTWDELELVHHWKAYLDAPMRYLRHTLADD
ncbi:AAA family ATPase [Nocardioides sp. Root140]|uniref:AAA family ATPase n=1 Tax=Nocardioides sp. Root140 TaxID=1736460 RepID=UPI0006FEFB5F|nr:AAA family ATPase [Nocardioides sp. Root140]KQY56529.1 AAA family ATPase [Nocardioides sp. Root140]